jgi:hypothetical protein
MQSFSFLTYFPTIKAVNIVATKKKDERYIVKVYTHDQ